MFTIWVVDVIIGVAKYYIGSIFTCWACGLVVVEISLDNSEASFHMNPWKREVQVEIRLLHDREHFSWPSQRQLVNCVKEIKLVFCENHGKSTNKHGLNVDILFKIKAGDTYSNYMAFSG